MYRGATNGPGHTSNLRLYKKLSEKKRQGGGTISSTVIVKRRGGGGTGISPVFNLKGAV